MSAAQQFFSEDDRYEIRHSCRFESVNTAHLYNTPSGDGNLDAWTFSAWVKLSKDIFYMLNKESIKKFSKLTNNGNKKVSIYDYE